MDQDKTLDQALGLLKAGQLPEAQRLYLEIFSLAPENFTALQYLGVIRLQQQRYPEALALIGAALKQRDDAKAHDPKLLAHYGSALQKLGRLDEALLYYDRALAMQPDLAAALYNRAVTLAGLKRFEWALQGHDAFLAIRPDDAEAHYNRGLTLLQLARADDALASLDRAKALGRSDADLLTARGAALRALRRFEEALAAHDVALAMAPDHVEAMLSRANVLGDLERLPEALAGYDKALAAAPGHAQGWNNRGSILNRMNRIEEAFASYDKVLALDPGDAQTLHKRGEMHWIERRDLEAAIRDLEQAASDPDYDFVLGDLLHLKMRQADWRSLDAQLAAIHRGVRAGRRVVQPLYYLSMSDSPADQQRCGVTWTKNMYPQTPTVAPAVWTGQKRRAGKIRVAYLAGEFRAHPAGYLTAGLFEQHDKETFEITALDNGWNDASPTRQRMEAAFSRMLDIAPLTDRAAAAMIAAEEFDIIVDLNGHTKNNRMGVLARRPAPVQVALLGFPGTLGASYMDYVLADRVVIPENEKKFFTEKVVYLPDTYWPEDSKRPVAGAAPARAACGLPERGLVFCNFNLSFKLMPDIFSLWMRVLQKTPGAVLWLLESSPACAENLRREAEARGVAATRLVFAPPALQEEHLARLALADLCLDTLPYNAHTTASDALWCGVPLVTCRGRTFAGRVAASLLDAIGLPELVSENLEEHEALILALAGDTARLKALRARLAALRRSAPLFDTARYCRHVEAAYTTMFERSQRGEAPQDFAVPPQS